jgi:4-amino-4-deoxy-L-arabinose transferase-like glycosyltransferase
LRTGPDRRPSVPLSAKAPRLTRLACLIGLAALALLPGLGGSARLSYHEAFVAQGAREMLSSGEWTYPTIGGMPWLEKPPLPWWLAAIVGRLSGGVNETVARLPSALAAMALVLGVAVLAARHYGPTISLLAGAVQATTAWTVIRGRLAESDVLLACLITWSIVAFDDMLSAAAEVTPEPGSQAPRWRRARWIFFALLGATALVKGVGFGAALVLPVVAAMLLWQRDGVTLRRFCFPAGWLLASTMALAWPLLMIARHGGGAIALWIMHVTDRLSGLGHFHGEPWWEYVPTILAQALPWTPLAAAGAFRSLGRACVTPFTGLRQGRRAAHFELPSVVVAGDRLLWVWTAVPLALLAIPNVKNAHYAITAQVPWSIWAALAVARIGESLRRRGWKRPRLRAAARGGFASLALAYGIGLWLIAPRLDRRGVEWSFYESIGRFLPATTSLTFLYDDWDRLPYESMLGSCPHDLAVRLFYVGRPACWHRSAESLRDRDHARCCLALSLRQSVDQTGAAGLDASEYTVVGRERDLPELHRIGHVMTLILGPRIREDRGYSLYRISKRPDDNRLAGRQNGERGRDQRDIPVTVPR